MTPRRRVRQHKGKGHRPHGRGTLEIDLTIHGVHIRRASGTTDPDVYALYCNMLRTLGSAGRIDILRQLNEKRNGRYVLKFSEVWDVVRPQVDRPVNLNRLPSPLTMRKLWAEKDDGDELGAFEAWAESRPGTADRKNKRRDVKALRRMGKTFQTVADLPSILEAYRDYCEATEHHRMFNAARSTVQAFLRDTVKRSHPLYGAVLDLPLLPEAPRPGRPLEAEEVVPWLARVERVLGPNHAQAFRGMMLTGMRLAEFWGAWELESDRVKIRSAKRLHGTPVVWRAVPRLAEMIAPPTMTLTAFADDWSEKKLGEFHGAYDARRTFSHACEAVGIPRSRIMAYLGHGIGSVTDLYLRHEVYPHLGADAVKLKEWFNLPETPQGLRLEKGA